MPSPLAGFWMLMIVSLTFSFLSLVITERQFPLLVTGTILWGAGIIFFIIGFFAQAATWR